MRKAKIGLLPFYLELYDNSSPQIRGEIESFYNKIAEKFEGKGVQVEKVEICRLENEFIKSIKHFEDLKVDCIVTLHLAYSPSLESIGALTKTDLPIFVLDTTPDFEFGPEQMDSKITFNHGIHGVQDMCNLLIRNGKSYQIEVGHWEKSDVIDRMLNWIKAAYTANMMKNMRIGRIGNSFKGMGDFAVPSNKLYSTIGVETVVADVEELKSFNESIEQSEIDDEIEKDKGIFDTDRINMDSYQRTIRACLGVRKWMEKENLSGFTVNFLDIDKESGLDVVPFLEASKAMARGYGYAGEGDVLTAALVGALGIVNSETTFTEMFCPDWKGNRIFLSHMGEMNYNLTAEKPVLLEKPFPYTDAENPVVAVGRYKPGKAVIVNLAPGFDDSYSLIVAPIEMEKVEGRDNLGDTIRGWFKPSMSIDRFLKLYSQFGGTHHSALVYGDVKDYVINFGKVMGWNVRVIE
ncbi:MAG: hypothetical protein PHP06_08280 [Clostridia bacterium]|nr:hypothetical protein [Clostridia bacterium]